MATKREACLQMLKAIDDCYEGRKVINASIFNSCDDLIKKLPANIDDYSSKQNVVIRNVAGKATYSFTLKLQKISNDFVAFVNNMAFPNNPIYYQQPDIIAYEELQLPIDNDVREFSSSACDAWEELSNILRADSTRIEQEAENLYSTFFYLQPNLGEQTFGVSDLEIGIKELCVMEEEFKDAIVGLSQSALEIAEDIKLIIAANANSASTSSSAQISNP